jgi:CheY-like chemotaxis protein
MATVVIADDDPLVLSTTTLLLHRVFGHRVETVSDASGILTCLRAVRPDVLLQDATMPGLVLQNLLRTIRDDPNFASLAIVVFTGLAPSGEDDFSQADAVVRKPFDPNRLNDLIDRFSPTA